MVNYADYARATKGPVNLLHVLDDSELDLPMNTLLPSP